MNALKVLAEFLQSSAFDPIRPDELSRIEVNYAEKAGAQPSAR
jgi:hypothetical protein